MANDKIKRPHHKSRLTKQQSSELIKCAQDLDYFIRNYVYILHTVKGCIKFELYEYQEKVVNNLQSHNKNIILQPRQSGKTTAIVAYLLHKAIFIPDTIIGVASHKGDGAKDIIERFKYAYEMLPFWMKPAVKSYNVFDVVFDNGSKIMSETTTETTYRGKSLSTLYLDEFAFVNPRIAAEFWKSTLPTLSAPGSEFIITSTPNTSEGKFAEIWFKAEQGLSEFRPTRVYNEEVPYGDGFRDEAYKKMMLQDMTELEYAQEFECRFVSNKGTLINSDILESLRPSEPFSDYLGLVLYDDLDDKRIGISVDVGTGTGKDYSVFQLFDLEKLEQVGQFRDNTLNLTDLTKRLIEILKFVNEKASEVFFSVEANSIGQGVIQLIENTTNKIFDEVEMVSTGKHGGILMTPKTKIKGCTKFKDLIESGRMKIHSKELISELKFFVKMRSSFAAESGKTDDLVMGCVIMCLLMEELSEYDEQLYDTLNSTNIIGDLDDDGDGWNEPMPFVF